MAWRKRGTWVWADLIYWFLYVPMTVGVIVSLVTIPSRLLATAVQPMPLDAEIFGERVFQNLLNYSAVSGSDRDVLTNNISEAVHFSLSPKKFAYEVRISGRPAFYGNEQFFSIAKPLAPVKYDVFSQKRIIANKHVVVTEVYPKRYETFK